MNCYVELKFTRIFKMWWLFFVFRHVKFSDDDDNFGAVIDSAISPKLG